MSWNTLGHDPAAQQHHELKQIALDQQTLSTIGDLLSMGGVGSFCDLRYQGIRCQAPRFVVRFLVNSSYRKLEGPAFSPATYFDNAHPLTIGLAKYAFKKYTVDPGPVLAGSVIPIIPVVVAYISLQQHIARGITLGSVKG